MTSTQRLAAILAVLTMAMSETLAQGTNSTPAITVEAVPACVIQSTPVIVDGTARNSGGGKTVAISIAPPSSNGAPVKLAAPLQGDGTFFADYAPPGLGNYVVTATSLQGTATAKASFQVVSPPVIKVDVAPRSVTAEPQSCSASATTPHTRITISGHTDMVCGERAVRILVTPPAPDHPHSVSVQADNTGNFLWSEDAPSSPGTYRVQALAPGGRATSESTFQVERPESDKGNPIELAIVSAPPGLGDEVIFKGMTPVDGTGPLRATVKPPSGPNIPVSVPVQPDGSFQFCMNNTSQSGNYNVCAESPGGRFSRKLSFKVDAGMQPPDTDPELGKMAVELVDQIKELNNALPASPATEGLDKDLTDVQAALLDSLKQIAEFDTKLHEILNLRNDYPMAGPAYDALLKQLEDFQDEAWKEEVKISALLQTSKPDEVKCDNTALIVEELNDLAELISTIQKPMEEVANWEASTVKGAGLEDPGHYCQGIANPNGQIQPESPTKLQFTKALEGIDPGDKPVQYFNTVLKEVQNVISRNSELVFDAYCQKFEGPVSGTMDADVETGGTRWWRYRIQLDGALTLRYPKGATGAVQLSGEFQGTATHIEVWENSYAVLFPDLLRGIGATYIHKVSAAVTPAGPHPVKMGFGANSPEATSSADFPAQKGTPTFGPADFRIPVKGTIEKNSVVLTLEPATHDFEEDVMKMRAKYLIFSMMTLAPNFQEIDFPPYKNARFMLMRAFEGERVEFPLKINPNSMEISKAFAPPPHGGPIGTRSRATATYTLNVRACNPGCLSNNPSPRSISANGKKAPAKIVAKH